MVREEKHFAGKRCLVFADEAPDLLLIEPMDERDLAFLDREMEILKAGAGRPFAFAALIIEDWNRERKPGSPRFAAEKEFWAATPWQLFSRSGARTKAIPSPA